MEFSSLVPTVCPNNSVHEIESSSVKIAGSYSDIAKVEEYSDGYFETSHVVMNIPSGTPGDITEHDVSWPMNFLLWKTLITPTSDMIGDLITVVASPETTVGVLTQTVNIGDSTFNVNSTVTDNTWRGFRIVLDDTVNKEVLNRCSAVDSVNGTISTTATTSQSFAAGSAVKIGVYVLKDINVTDTQTIEIGAKGIKGKTIPANMILRVYYTNNSGTSKVLKWRVEGYNTG